MVFKGRELIIQYFQLFAHTDLTHTDLSLKILRATAGSQPHLVTPKSSAPVISELVFRKDLDGLLFHPLCV